MSDACDLFSSVIVLTRYHTSSFQNLIHLALIHFDTVSPLCHVVTYPNKLDVRKLLVQNSKRISYFFDFFLTKYHDLAATQVNNH